MIKVLLNFNEDCCGCMYNLLLCVILAGQICIIVVSILIYLYLCQMARYKHERFILHSFEDKKKEQS